jgi:hypothetical protein
MIEKLKGLTPFQGSNLDMMKKNVLRERLGLHVCRLSSPAPGGK